ncbi:MAG: hypothetical protein GDA35_03170 [Hyphomonadaceae bacterium]|nr:hypothetical protein [Hyphomonadaceae bacterium]
MTAEDDFQSEFVRPEVELEAPSPLDFEPWHKPRKQYVRKHQWQHYAKERIQELKKAKHFEGEVPLKYFTLPGPDLLDVRLMIKLCRRFNVRLHYTGFCYDQSKQQDRLRQNISQFRNDHGNVVVSESNVRNLSFQNLGKPKSPENTALIRGGPYQLVNIDACKSIASGDVKSAARLIDGLKAIFEYQINKCSEPWILLITSHIQQGNVEEKSLDSLFTSVKTNHDACDSFKKALESKFEGAGNLDDFYCRVRAEHSAEFLNFATLGISKWLVHLGESAKARVKTLDGFCYSTFGHKPLVANMVSICYLIEKLPASVVDRSGLTEEKTQNPPPKFPYENDHMEALEKSYSMTNLDDYLKSNKCTYEELVEENIKLLTEAGYSVGSQGGEYRNWLSKHDMVYNCVMNQ